MRINRLDLSRFGPFTDKSFDFSSPGIHLIVGNNEAGKTVSMAAIRQLLFGIPMRTTYDFVHKKADLRLGAQVENEGGATLEIVRLKKNSDTLRDQDGSVLDEGLLARLLHGIDEGVFASLFTVGHDEIAAGGEALLDSDGEVGRALFSASRGTTDLTAALRELDERADSLFKQRSSKPLLNAAIRDFKEVSAAATSQSKSASEVLDLDSKLATAQDDHDQMAAQRKQLDAQRSLLDRVRASRPALASRRDHFNNRVELEADGPLVDSTVRLWLEEAQSGRKEGKSARLAAALAIKRLEGKLGELSVDSALLDQQDGIANLTRASGGFDQNEEDLPGLKVKANVLKQDLVQRRKRLPVDSPLAQHEYAGLAINDEQRILQLAADCSDLKNNLRHAVAEVDETKRSLQSLHEEQHKIGEPANVAALVDVLTRIRLDGDLETSRSSHVRDLELLDRTLTRELASMGLSDIDIRSIDAIAVPMIETIRQIRDDSDKRTGSITRLEEQIAGSESSSTEAAQELDELLRSEEPLSAEDLQTSRLNRDAGWQLVRGAWLDEPTDADATASWGDGKPLQDAYEAAVEEADGVADRLRRQASAVERRASLEQNLTTIDRDLQKLRNDLTDVLKTHSDAEDSWTLLWEPLGVTPRSPAEMEGWHEDYRACVQRSEESRILQIKIADLEATISRHCSDLVASISAVDKSLPNGLSLLGLADHAEQVVDAAATTEQRHKDVFTACKREEELLDKRALTHDRAEKAMASWRLEWSRAMATLGLEPTASTGEADSIIGALRDISEITASLEDLERRTFGISLRSTEFTEGVAAVLATLDGHEDLMDAHPAAALKMLDRRVKEAREIATESKAIVEELASHNKAKDEADLVLNEAASDINKLVKDAGVSEESELSDAIHRSEEHTKIIGHITDLENHLRAGAGKPLDEIVAEVAEWADVEIEPEVQQLDRELESLDAQIKDKQTKVGELTNQRSLIGPSQDAADFMTQAQQSLASISDYSDEYVQIMLARRLLEEHVNAYRDENQGPLLDRASKLFCGLTLQRYVGLDTDVDNKGNPFLLACHADDKLLEVNTLSTGTRDQLYLALRLAALEQFMARRGPLPIVFDDLFVQFDDDRTKAGLKILDALAAKTQVLIFTHHSEVAKQAREVIDSSRLTVHSLG